jgi:ApaG protein
VSKKVSAETEGIVVEVQSVYLEAHSDPDEPRYVFAYNVHIKNHGEQAATLVSRHWVITDARGTFEEVRGPGIVGETPLLEPGEEHAYQSFCVLKTPRGTMHGTYQMIRTGGEKFEAEIPSFLLTTGSNESKLVLN